MGVDLNVNNSCLRAQKPSTNGEVSAPLSEMYERVVAVNRPVCPSARRSPAEWTSHRNSQTFRASRFQQPSRSAWQTNGQPFRQQCNQRTNKKSAKLSDRKQTSQELVRHYVCQPVKQEATLSDHQPGSVPALGYMRKSSRRFKERVLLVKD